MNILDWVVVVIIVYTTLTGIYRGFIHSASSLGAFFLSWAGAAIFAPVLSRSFVKNQNVFDFVYNYTEGSERLTSFDFSKLKIAEQSPEYLNELIADSNLPAPFAGLMRSNVADAVFADQGVTTLGEYYNLTIANVCINIISFFIIFFVARAVLAFVINALNYTLKFPVLRLYDSTIGGVFGFLSGIFITYAVFIVTPLLLVVQPIQEVYNIVYDSAFAHYFYTSNFILNFIRGII